MKTSRRRAFVPLALAAALALSACSGEEPAQFEETAQGASAAGADETTDKAEADDAADDRPSADDAGVAATGEAPGSGDEASQETDDVSGQSAAAAGIDPQTLGDPIATVTIPAVVEGDPDATMEVSLYSLVRDGNTVVGTYSFRVDSDEERERWIYHYLGGASWRPFLVDTVNLNRHDVLGEGAHLAATDGQGAQFRPGTTFYAYASFAAPPPDVTTMTAYLVDGAPAIPDVEIP